MPSREEWHSDETYHAQMCTNKTPCAQTSSCRSHNSATRRALAQSRTEPHALSMQSKAWMATRRYKRATCAVDSPPAGRSCLANFEVFWTTGVISVQVEGWEEGRGRSLGVTRFVSVFCAFGYGIGIGWSWVHLEGYTWKQLDEEAKGAQSRNWEEFVWVSLCLHGN